MSFWESLTVEVLGGVATAIFLGVIVAWRDARASVERHDREVQALDEDLNRFMRDRDRLLRAEKNAELADARARNGGTSNAGVLVQIDAKCCRRALREYRNHMTPTKRAYERIKTAEGATHRLVRRKPLRRLVMHAENHETLKRWRADKEISSVVAEVDDPTSVEREPRLRAFEDEVRP